MNHEQVPIWQQYTMTIEEASRYFRIGERKLRKFVEEHKDTDLVIMNGNRVQIKRKKFGPMSRFSTS